MPKFSRILLVVGFVSVTSQLLPLVRAQCGTPPSPPPYAILDSVSAVYYCPAHWVFDTTWTRRSNPLSCVYNGISSFVWSPSTPGNCIPATCVPACSSGTCMCGITKCRCICATGYTGSDCSIYRPNIPRVAQLSLFYPFSDPHWIAIPERSTRPFLLDISANALHGEIYGDLTLVMGSSSSLEMPYYQFSNYYTRYYAAFQFGAYLPDTPGYINVTDSRYNLTAISFGPGKYSYLMYWYPTGANFDENLVLSYNTATQPGTWFSAGYGVYGSGNSYLGDFITQASVMPCCGLVSDAWNLAGFHYDTVGGYFNNFQRTALKTSSKTVSVIKNAYTTSNQGLFIGYNVNDPVNFTSPPVNFLVGRFSGFGIWGPAVTPAMNVSEMNSFLSFLVTSVGNRNTDLQNSAMSCPIAPVATYAMPGYSVASIPYSSTILYMCPPGYKFGVNNNRMSIIQCQSSYWYYYPAGSSTLTPGTCVASSLNCDPICLNGGTCVLGPPSSCNCVAGFTGPDCSIMTADILNITSNGNVVGIWPLMIDFTIPSGGQLLAMDISGNNNHLIIGDGVAWDNGKYGMNGMTSSSAYGTAFKFSSNRAKSLLRSMPANAANFTLTFPGGPSAHRIFYYSKYNNPSAPGMGQPVLTWGTPSGSTTRGLSFWIDEASGKMKYFAPDGTSKLLSGSLYNSVNQWMDVRIELYANDTVAADAVPFYSASNPINVSAALPTSGGFYVGYSDYQSEITSDISISCLAIIKDATGSDDWYATSLSRICQMASKLRCSGHANLTTTGFLSPTTAYHGESANFTCLPGYRLAGSNDVRSETITCALPAGKPPQMQFSDTMGCELVTGGYCLPNCTNGGTCIVGTPSTCSCPANTFGVDCSLLTCNLPQLSSLLGLWPMTSTQLNYQRKFVEARQLSSATVHSSVSFVMGPNPTIMLVDLSNTTVPAPITATTPSSISSTFTIAAFIKFTPAVIDITYMSWPFFAVAQHCIYITIAPSGLFTFQIWYSSLYPVQSSGSMATSIGFNNRVFVSFSFSGSCVEIGMNGATFTSLCIGYTPYIPNTQIFIGSGDPSYGGTRFPGEVSCFSLYNTALSQSDVALLMQNCLSYIQETPFTCLTTTVPTTVITTTPNTTVVTYQCPNNMTITKATLIGSTTSNVTSVEHGTILTFLCLANHQFPDFSIVANAICNNGTWDVAFMYCESVETASISSLTNVSDTTLLSLTNDISSAILDSSTALLSMDTNSSDFIDNALGAADAMSSLFSRFADNVDKLTPDQAKAVSKSFSSAISNVMTALLKETDSSSSGTTPEPTDDAAADGDNSWKCVNGGEIQKSAPPAVLTEDQTAKLYQQFLGMTNALTTIISVALVAGDDFLINEKFFSAQIIKRQFQVLPGLFLDCQLSSVYFPNSSDYAGLDLLLEGNTLAPTDMVSIVMYGYINNVFDATQPFNTPTISLALYDPSRKPLHLNPKIKILQVGKPLRRKALQFAKQKVDAQCDVSKVTCNLEENADKLASMATFPLDAVSGPFILIFPPIPFDFTAYVALNTTPTPTNCSWAIDVNNMGSKGSAVVKSNGTFILPIHYSNDSDIGTRAIVPVEAIALAIGNADPSTVRLSLNVLAKKRFGSLSLANLPAAACEMQRVYGYHLNLKPAKKNNTNKGRKRRAVATDPEYLELLPESTEAEIRFVSNYMGDIGADLAIPPNTIALSDVLANFTELVADNWGVLAFVTVSVVFFIVGAICAWRWDRSDIDEWAYLPLLDNKRQQSYSYLVSVLHHNVKNYNTRGRVFLRLIGNVDQTKWRCLRDGIRKNFHFSRPENFIMNTYYSMGDRLKLQLCLSEKPPSVDLSTAMSLFITEVLIVDIHRSRKYIFKVSKRIKADDKVLSFDLPCEDDIKDWGYLVKRHVRTKLSDAHPWFSILHRPLPSDWTRVERLACVVSGLFMAMLVNCMFYGKEAASPKAGISIGGIFRISWFTIWTSLIGSVIIIPPTACMGLIFKKVQRRSANQNAKVTVFNVDKLKKPRTEKDDEDEPAGEEEEEDDEDTVKHSGFSNSQDEKEERCCSPLCCPCTRNSKEDRKLYEKKKEPKKPFKLPYGCIFIAWFLVVACLGVSTFFIVMYSLSWGREKSLQWLTGMVLHVLQDIIIIQTIKVMIMAIVNSTLLKKHEDGFDANMKTAMNSDNKRYKTELFKRFRNTIVGLAHNVLYVISFSMVIGMTLNPYGFSQIDAIRPLVTIPGMFENSGMIDYPQVFDWLATKFTSNILGGNQFYTEKMRRIKFYSTINHDVYLVGPIRLRQQRVATGPCPIKISRIPGFINKYGDLLDKPITHCQDEYTNVIAYGTSSERRAFNGSWYDVISDSTFDYLDYNTSLALKSTSWAYRETSGMTYAGWQAAYGTGGYYVDLPSTLDKAVEIITALRNNRWLDNATTVLLVELTLMNPQLNLFVPVKVVFEALPASGMTYHTRLYPLQLYQYFGPDSLLTLAVQGIWLLLNITHTIELVVKFKRAKRKFLRDGWNLLETTSVLLSFAIMGIYVCRFPFILTAISAIKTDRKSYVNLDNLVVWEDWMMGLFGIAFMMNLMLFFRYLSFNKQWSIFVGTLANGRDDVTSFLAIFVFLTTMFAAFGHLTIGNSDKQFSSLARGMLTLCYNVVGFNSEFMQSAENSKIAFVFYSMYSLLVYFMGIQVFMSIVTVAYGEVSSNVTKLTKWDAALSNYINRGVRNLLSIGKKKPGENKDKNAIMIPKKKVDRVTGTLERLSSFAESKMAASIAYDEVDDWIAAFEATLKKPMIKKAPFQRATLVKRVKADADEKDIINTMFKVEFPKDGRRPSSTGFSDHKAITEARKDVSKKLVAKIADQDFDFSVPLSYKK